MKEIQLSINNPVINNITTIAAAKIAKIIETGQLGNTHSFPVDIVSISKEAKTANTLKVYESISNVMDQYKIEEETLYSELRNNNADSEIIISHAEISASLYRNVTELLEALRIDAFGVRAPYSFSFNFSESPMVSQPAAVEEVKPKSVLMRKTTEEKDFDNRFDRLEKKLKTEQTFDFYKELEELRTDITNYYKNRTNFIRNAHNVEVQLMRNKMRVDKMISGLLVDAMNS